MIVENMTLEIAGEASQTVVYRETVFGPMVTEFVSDSQGEEFAARAYPMAGKTMTPLLVVSNFAWSSADGAYLASRLNTKFRIAETGPEIQATYGGSENGYVLFTKTMAQALTADPGFVPTANEISFVNTMLADAWNAAAAVPQNQWAAAYRSEAVVSNFFASALMPFRQLGRDLNSAPESRYSSELNCSRRWALRSANSWSASFSPQAGIPPRPLIRL